MVVDTFGEFMLVCWLVPVLFAWTVGEVGEALAHGIRN